MSHTDLAIIKQIQSLGLTLFQVSITDTQNQGLPTKIPLKPMKNAFQALEKVRHFRFSHKQGYHIGLIALEPDGFCVLESQNTEAIQTILNQERLSCLYCNDWNEHRVQWWFDEQTARMVWQLCQSHDIAIKNLSIAQGQASLAGFKHTL